MDLLVLYKGIFISVFANLWMKQNLSFKCYSEFKNWNTQLLQHFIGPKLGLYYSEEDCVKVSSAQVSCEIPTTERFSLTLDEGRLDWFSLGLNSSELSMAFCQRINHSPPTITQVYPSGNVRRKKGPHPHKNMFCCFNLVSTQKLSIWCY